MREIKFRAWDKKQECMDYDFYVHSNGGIFDKARTSYDTPNIEIEEENNFEIMQYTGLKDKNGKDIYEGDIIENDTCIYQIEFKDGLFRDTDGFLLCDIYDYSEIIGNIYENQELLKGDIYE